MGQNLQESRDLARLQAQINQMNQVTPFGSLMFTGPVDDKGRRDPTQTTATTTLSPELQALFGQQIMGQQLAGGQAQNMLGAFQGGPVFGGQQNPFQMRDFGPAAQAGRSNPFNLLNLMRGNDLNFEQSRNDVENATFQRALSLLNPEFQRQENSMQQRLANQGLPQASGAYTAETGRFDDTRNRALEQAAFGAVLAGGQEQTRQLQNLLGTSQAGIGQALGLRQQLGNEQLQGYGANLQGNQFNLNAGLANRQVPFNELLSLFNVGSGMPQPNFFAPGQTQVQNMATQGQGSGALFSGLGTLLGGGLGAYLGGPAGARAGAQVGGGAGGLFGGLF